MILYDGNQDENKSELTLKRTLHNNKIYKRVVRKRIVVKEVNRKQVKLGVLLNDIGQFNKTGSLSYK